MRRWRVLFPAIAVAANGGDAGAMLVGRAGDRSRAMRLARPALLALDPR